MSDTTNQQEQQKQQQRRNTRAEERSIPFNCSMPYAEFCKLEQTADDEGISRSELLRRAMQLYYNNQAPK